MIIITIYSFIVHDLKHLLVYVTAQFENIVNVTKHASFQPYSAYAAGVIWKY